eukprot:TRINITY_DN111850_c0_g1_i1.p1 TRINITY_DN111850_c0_g1~~TRINITY_DN111850_c0_g1_i1.p1  ORF type:complete len:277 (+),score=52.23 TRINITY_DN111850_c0_g1_i1:94-924(+)
MQCALRYSMTRPSLSLAWSLLFFASFAQAVDETALTRASEVSAVTTRGGQHARHSGRRSGGVTLMRRELRASMEGDGPADDGWSGQEHEASAAEVGMRSGKGRRYRHRWHPSSGDVAVRASSPPPASSERKKLLEKGTAAEHASAMNGTTKKACPMADGEDAVAAEDDAADDRVSEASLVSTAGELHVNLSRSESKSGVASASAEGSARPGRKAPEFVDVSEDAKRKNTAKGHLRSGVMEDSDVVDNLRGHLADGVATQDEMTVAEGRRGPAPCLS